MTSEIDLLLHISNSNKINQIEMQKTNSVSTDNNLQIFNHSLDIIDSKDRCIKKILRIFIYLLPTLISIIFYLIGSSGNFSFYSQTRYFINMILILISSILFAIDYILLFEKKIPVIFAFFPNFFILFLIIIINNGSNGIYTKKLLIYSILTILSLYLIIKTFRYLFRNSFRLFLLIMTILFTIVTLFSDYKMRISCSDWEKGLGGIKIDNKDGCKIKYPKICFIDIFLNWFDFSAFNNNESCESIENNNFDLLKSYIGDLSGKKIAFPRTEYYSFFNKSEQEYFTQNVREDIVIMEMANRTNIDREVIVNFNQKPPVVEINIRRNETLIKERSILFQQYKHSVLSKNVLILYIDSLSRQHFKRQLKNTFNWFNRKYNNFTSEYEAFQFLKYHILGGNTRSNMIPGNFGVNEGGPVYGNHFVEEFKQKGFIAGNAMDYCSREVFESYSEKEKSYLGFSSFDHEFASLYCDPNFGDLSTGGFFLNGPYGIRKHCLYSKPTYEYMFEYMKQFWETYPNEAKMFRFGSMQAHEPTGEVIKYMDNSLNDFLNYFEDKGYLKDTILVFMSDHGLTQTGVSYYINAEDFIIEKSFPTLLIILNKSISSYQLLRNNLRMKEQEMVTAFDIYQTLNSITTGTLRGLFLENHLNNSCEKLHIESIWCKCSDI